MTTRLFTESFRTAPYWWDEAPRPAAEDAVLPDSADVVVIGSGYTGLHVALQTARGGLDTVVLDAEALGAGCSSRNGGQVSPSVKGSFPELRRRYGEEQALALLKDGLDALDFLEDFISREGIDCHWARCGRFSGAHNPAALKHMTQDLESLPESVSQRWHSVPREAQREEIGSDFYHGGIVYPDHAALHPGRYQLALLERVRLAGARTLGHCPATGIERRADGFRVQTPRGAIRAREVAVATNGYTGRLTPWLRRRVIPIGSYIIATEPLDRALADEVSPQNRVMSDSRKLVFYYRLCERRERMLFGGRVALRETDPRVSAPALHRAMGRIFPQLRETRISHSWLGFVAYTFDTLPHVGLKDGIHYAMGYCGSGVSLASYCGHLLGRTLAGEPEAVTAFGQLSFPTRPLYGGNPWFLEPAVFYYKLRDRLNV